MTRGAIIDLQYLSTVSPDVSGSVVKGLPSSHPSLADTSEFIATIARIGRNNYKSVFKSKRGALHDFGQRVDNAPIFDMLTDAFISG